MLGYLLSNLLYIGARDFDTRQTTIRREIAKRELAGNPASQEEIEIMVRKDLPQLRDARGGLSRQTVRDTSIRLRAEAKKGVARQGMEFVTGYKRGALKGRGGGAEGLKVAYHQLDGTPVYARRDKPVTVPKTGVSGLSEKERRFIQTIKKQPDKDVSLAQKGIIKVYDKKKKTTSYIDLKSPSRFGKEVLAITPSDRKTKVSPSAIRISAVLKEQRRIKKQKITAAEERHVLDQTGARGLAIYRLLKKTQKNKEIIVKDNLIYLKDKKTGRTKIIAPDRYGREVLAEVPKGTKVRPAALRTFADLQIRKEIESDKRLNSAMKGNLFAAWKILKKSPKEANNFIKNIKNKKLSKNDYAGGLLEFPVSLGKGIYNVLKAQYFAFKLSMKAPGKLNEYKGGLDFIKANARLVGLLGLTKILKRKRDISESDKKKLNNAYEQYQKEINKIKNALQTKDDIDLKQLRKYILDNDSKLTLTIASLFGGLGALSKAGAVGSFLSKAIGRGVAGYAVYGQTLQTIEKPTARNWGRLTFFAIPTGIAILKTLGKLRPRFRPSVKNVAVMNKELTILKSKYKRILKSKKTKPAIKKKINKELRRIDQAKKEIKWLRKNNQIIKTRDFNPITHTKYFKKLQGSYRTGIHVSAQPKISKLFGQKIPREIPKGAGFLTKAKLKILDKLAPKKNPSDVFEVVTVKGGMGKSRIQFKENHMYFDFETALGYSQGKKYSIIKFPLTKISKFPKNLRILVTKAANGELTTKQSNALRLALNKYIKANKGKFFISPRTSSMPLGEREIVLAESSKFFKANRYRTFDNDLQKFISIIEVSFKRNQKIPYLKKLKNAWASKPFKTLKYRLRNPDILIVRKYANILKRGKKLTTPQKNIFTKFIEKIKQKQKQIVKDAKTQTKHKKFKKPKDKLKVEIGLKPEVRAKLKAKAKRFKAKVGKPLKKVIKPVRKVIRVSGERLSTINQRSTTFIKNQYANTRFKIVFKKYRINQQIKNISAPALRRINLNILKTRKLLRKSGYIVTRPIINLSNKVNDILNAFNLKIQFLDLKLGKYLNRFQIKRRIVPRRVRLAKHKINAATRKFIKLNQKKLADINIRIKFVKYNAKVAVSNINKVVMNKVNNKILRIKRLVRTSKGKITTQVNNVVAEINNLLFKFNYKIKLTKYKIKKAIKAIKRPKIVRRAIRSTRQLNTATRKFIVSSKTSLKAVGVKVVIIKNNALKPIKNISQQTIKKVNVRIQKIKKILIQTQGKATAAINKLVNEINVLLSKYNYKLKLVKIKILKQLKVIKRIGNEQLSRINAQTIQRIKTKLDALDIKFNITKYNTKLRIKQISKPLFKKINIQIRALKRTINRSGDFVARKVNTILNNIKSLLREANIKIQFKKYAVKQKIKIRARRLYKPIDAARRAVLRRKNKIADEILKSITQIKNKAKQANIKIQFKKYALKNKLRRLTEPKLKQIDKILRSIKRRYNFTKGKIDNKIIKLNKAIKNAIPFDIRITYGKRTLIGKPIKKIKIPVMPLKKTALRISLKKKGDQFVLEIRQRSLKQNQLILRRIKRRLKLPNLNKTIIRELTFRKKLVENNIRRIVKRKQTTRVRKTVTRTRKPVTRTRKPVNRARKTTTRTRKPVTRTRKPVTRKRKPVTRARKPVTRTRKPVTRARKPITRVKKPVTRTRALLLRKRQIKKKKEEFEKKKKKLFKRLKRIKQTRGFIYLPDLFSIIMGLTANKVEQRALLRTGRMFTGLEVRKKVIR